MSTLLIGATGFIGSHFAQQSISLGKDTVFSVRSISNAEALFLPWATKHNRTLQLVESDLHDRESLFHTISARSFDTVIYAAAIAAQTYQAGVEAVSFDTKAFWHVLEACKAANVKRIIFLSSPSVYGTNEALMHESDPLQPITEYGLGKKICSGIAEYYRTSSTMEIIECRLFNVFGPGDKGTRLIPQIFRNLSQNTPVTLKTPHSVADFIYIDDAVQALQHLTDCSYIHPIVNLCTSKGHSIRDVAFEIADILGSAEDLIVSPSDSNHALTQTVGSNEFLKQLGYYPQIDLRTGLKRMAAAFR